MRRSALSTNMDQVPLEHHSPLSNTTVAPLTTLQYHCSTSLPPLPISPAPLQHHCPSLQDHSPATPLQYHFPTPLCDITSPPLQHLQHLPNTTTTPLQYHCPPHLLDVLPMCSSCQSHMRSIRSHTFPHTLVYTSS